MLLIQQLHHIVPQTLTYPEIAAGVAVPVESLVSRGLFMRFEILPGVVAEHVLWLVYSRDPELGFLDGMVVFVRRRAWLASVAHACGGNDEGQFGFSKRPSHGVDEIGQVFPVLRGDVRVDAVGVALVESEADDLVPITYRVEFGILAGREFRREIV